MNTVHGTGGAKIFGFTGEPAGYEREREGERNLASATVELQVGAGAVGAVPNGPKTQQPAIKDPSIVLFSGYYIEQGKVGADKAVPCSILSLGVF